MAKLKHLIWFRGKNKLLIYRKTWIKHEVDLKNKVSTKYGSSNHQHLLASQERMTMPVLASLCELVTRSADTIFYYENNLQLVLFNFKYITFKITDFSNRQQSTGLPSHGSHRACGRSKLIKSLCFLNKNRINLLF